MTLSRKIVLVIVSTFIALVFIVAVTSDIILLNSFSTLEKKVLNDNLAKVINEIEESFPELDGSAKDYADIYQQAVGARIGGLDVNSFVSHRIDFIACFNRNAELISAKVMDFHGRRQAQMAGDQLRDIQRCARYFGERANDKQLYGYITVGYSVAQIAVRSLESGQLLLVGKFFDKEEVQRVSSLTKFNIEAKPYNNAALHADFIQARTRLADGTNFHSSVNKDGQISGYSLFNDIYGKPVLLLKITEPRLIYEQGKVSINYILLALFVSGGVFCGVMLLFMRGTVLKRLATLSSTVGEISKCGDISERVEIVGEDELEDLAASINTMLASLETAEQDLKESEERYRALFERAPDSIIIIGTEGDERGRIVAANRAAAAQHGYTVEELCSLSIHDLNTPETNLISNDLMEKIMQGDWVTSELWHLKKDGSRFPIEIHAGPIKLGRSNYILGFDRDITSRKIAEESDRMYLEQISWLNTELSVKASELANANKELETFNYSVSHDMRGPLTRISGYCQLMLDDCASLDPQGKTYLSRIYESCCWLDEMLDAMLKLSQLTRVDFVPSNVNLSAIIEDHLSELVQAEPNRAINAVIAPDVMAVGDARLLKILVSNLVNNAWKYSSRCEKTHIEFGVMKQDSVPVYFVRDHGAGFDMKDADKLFRVFTRLHDPARFSGSGIGLATVQRVIARHGGRVWAEGEVGHGATFFFTLVPDQHGAK
jgi:PAS domain S-box-containing protein